jgi:hypothetical protein
VTRPAVGSKLSHRALALALSLGLAALLGVLPADRAQAQDAKVPNVTGPGDVAWLLGALPQSCVELDDAHYCAWRVRDSIARWSQIAKLFDMQERFALTCAFTNTQSALIHDRCQAHAYNSGHNGNAIYGKNASKKDKQKMRDAAIARIETASSLSAVVGLTGDAPSACIDAGDDQVVCEWQLRGSTPGYRTFAVASGHVSKKIRAVCRFVENGESWKTDGCQVGILD